MVPSLRAGAGAGVPLFPGTRKNCDLPRGMVPSLTPKRDHGDPQALRLRRGGKGNWRALRDYSSGSVGGSFFFAFFRLMLIAEASRLFLRWEA